MRLAAVIFDFDGVVLDTETPLYRAWARVFERHGVEPIPLERWADSLGRHEHDPAVLDPVRILEEALGRPVDAEAVHVDRRRFRDELLDAAPVQPGLHQLLDQATDLGLPLAIASSSGTDWVERHLDARGLLDRFAVRSCAGDGVPGKPDPSVYLRAARDLCVDPERCLAFEDTPHGAAAAKAAGVTCVAVPIALSASLDFSHADLVVDSLLSVDLRDWT